MIFATPALPIVDRPADRAHFLRGSGQRKRLIILHHTGGSDSAAWLSTTSSPPVSTHRLITKAGANLEIVQDADIAYTAGYGVVGPVDPDANDPAGVTPNVNYASLNIELGTAATGATPFRFLYLASERLPVVAQSSGADGPICKG